MGQRPPPAPRADTSGPPEPLASSTAVGGVPGSAARGSGGVQAQEQGLVSEPVKDDDESDSSSDDSSSSSMEEVADDERAGDDAESAGSGDESAEAVE